MVENYSKNFLYKILRSSEWTDFNVNGRFTGSSDDVRDGFIHFSYAYQVAETARKYFRGEEGLMLVAVSPYRLGENLRNEVSRNGQKFPHLYAALEMQVVLWARMLSLDADGVPVIPPLEEEIT